MDAIEHLRKHLRLRAGVAIDGDVQRTPFGQGARSPKRCHAAARSEAVMNRMIGLQVMHPELMNEPRFGYLPLTREIEGHRTADLGAAAEGNHGAGGMTHDGSRGDAHGGRCECAQRTRDGQPLPRAAVPKWSQREGGNSLHDGLFRPDVFQSIEALRKQLWRNSWNHLIAHACFGQGQGMSIERDAGGSLTGEDQTREDGRILDVEIALSLKAKGWRRSEPTPRRKRSGRAGGKGPAGTTAEDTYGQVMQAGFETKRELMRRVEQRRAIAMKERVEDRYAIDKPFMPPVRPRVDDELLGGDTQVLSEQPGATQIAGRTEGIREIDLTSCSPQVDPIELLSVQTQTVQQRLEKRGVR